MFVRRYPFRKLFTSYISYVNSSCKYNLHFKPKFTDEEQTKILSVINHKNINELAKFDVTKGRIKNMEIWKMKNGPFRSLSEVLEVQGLGEKILERLCDSIIHNRTNGTSKTSTGNRKQLITPQCEEDVLNSLQSAVGIHTSTTGVSWVKLKRERNEVDCWNVWDFSFLPKKISPFETYSLAVEILRRLPSADVYIMEATPMISPQYSQATKVMPTYNQQMELTSMLLALINSSPKHGNVDRLDNVSMKDGEYDIRYNKVYFLRAYLSARLFKILLGNERVTSDAIMTKLLGGMNDLPCTGITTAGDVKSDYLVQSNAHKDLMGQALMLIISFMDLCVYKNSISLQAVNHGRRN